MSSWSDKELAALGSAVELDLASRRPDGAVGDYTTMWVVRVDDEVYVRSAGGPNRPWYRRASSTDAGHIHAGEVDSDVTVERADPQVHPAIDAAYHAKYDRFGPGPVSHVTGANSHAVTIRLARSAA